MTLFLTADTHFGHVNIIAYSKRPFADVAEMDAGLLDRWNDTIRPHDEVWHLGDVAMGQLHLTLPVVHRLHGRKHLVPCNHDRCWPGYAKAAQWTKAYTDLGFTLLPVQTSLQVAGVEVVVCHFPYRDLSIVQERYAQHRPVDDGRWLLHGHVHDAWQVNGQMINVGVDVWDQRPVELAAIERLLAMHF